MTKLLKTLKLGTEVLHGTYGNVLTITTFEAQGTSLRVVYTAKDGSTIENTYSARTLRTLKVKVA